MLSWIAGWCNVKNAPQYGDNKQVSLTLLETRLPIKDRDSHLEPKPYGAPEKRKSIHCIVPKTILSHMHRQIASLFEDMETL